MAHTEYNSKKAKRTKTRKRKYTLAVLSILFALIFAAVGSGFIYAGTLLNSVNFVPVPNNNTQNGENNNNNTTTIVKRDFANPAMKNGLYHDEAVINVLIVGSDGFHGAGERSDSMLLLSIDRRNKKLKLTSFMRDMYLSLADGWADNRINAAYALGGVSCLISTIEENFSIDIDRYVTVDYDAVASIIDLLGGVEIELSAAEAEQVNLYSEDYTSYATEGLNTLTGLQARYYMRIRDVMGDDGYGDFSRTSRQRKVLSSLLNKFKGSNLITITKLANEIIPQITTDFSQNELASIVTNALTYMNYDFHQLRLPADDMYYSDWVVISGWDASVLIPDLELNSALLNDFVYEDSFPENGKTLLDADFERPVG